MASICDINRVWIAKLPALIKLFPEAKFVCLVRDVAWIMDSMERQFQNNAFENTRIFSHPNQRATVYTRTESLAGSNSNCGLSLPGEVPRLRNAMRALLGLERHERFRSYEES